MCRGDPVALLRQATSAARINDARVLTAASGREKSIHQWKELRTFDPGEGGLHDPSVPQVGSEPATPSLVMYQAPLASTS